VTFVFTDIEGSTRLFRELRDDFVELLEQHNAVLRGIWTRFDRREVKTEGDAFFVAFADAAAAIDACEWLRMQCTRSGSPLARLTYAQSFLDAHPDHTAARVALLTSAALTAVERGDGALADQFIAEALAVRDEYGEPDDVRGHLEHVQAVRAIFAGDYDRAIEIAELSLASNADRRELALNPLLIAHAHLGRYAEARAAGEEQGAHLRTER
jgi:class 3 adenylate cyclase